MKKIILFLALLSLGVSKAQVVGGYLPVNSTKSATMGGLRVNGNETVTGTFSVGSTATVSGNALFSSSVGIGALPTSSLSSFRLVKGTGSVDIGQPFAGYGGLWMGSSSPSTTNFLLASDGSNPSVNGATSLAFQISNNTKLLTNSGGVNVTGSLTASSTFSLGSANLTGGNTGTLAVLSDAVFCVNFSSTNSNPADGTTYYIGNASAYLVTNSAFGTIRIPYNCTLVSWEMNWIGSPGSNETATLSVSGTTNYTLNSSVTYTNASAIGTYSASGLSQNFNAGDVENIKMVCPTWATTNPTALYQGFTLWFVRRS